jgi:hypothetical protein
VCRAAADGRIFKRRLDAHAVADRPAARQLKHAATADMHQVLYPPLRAPKWARLGGQARITDVLRCHDSARRAADLLAESADHRSAGLSAGLDASSSQRPFVRSGSGQNADRTIRSASTGCRSPSSGVAPHSREAA